MRLYSVDRIEADKAVLIAEDHVVCVVRLVDLPDAKAGNVYRKEGNRFIRDSAAESAKKERICRLQKRIQLTK